MWIQPIVIPCGKSMCTSLITHPEWWGLTVDLSEAEQNIDVSVSKATYETIKDGASVTVQNSAVTNYTNP